MSQKNILIIIGVIVVVYLLLQGKAIDYAKRLSDAANPFNLGNTVTTAGLDAANNGGATTVDNTPQNNVYIQTGTDQGGFEIDLQGSDPSMGSTVVPV